MAQEVVESTGAAELRNEWDARHAAEPWWSDWLQIRELIETSRVAEARTLVKELAARWPHVALLRHYEHVLAPPEVRAVRRKRRYDPRGDYRWLREHAHEYAGSWLAVHHGRLVAADADLQRVIEIADAEVGGSDALLARAPDRPKLNEPAV